MWDVLAITGPIFILVALGFVTARGGLISAEQVRGMGTFVITFALPALVFKAVSERKLSEVLHPEFLLAYAVAALATFAIGFFIAKRLRKENLSTSSILAMGMSVSNSGFVGFPIAYMVVGQTAALGMALVMLVENLLMLPLALALAEAGRQSGSGKAVLQETLLRLAKNPLIIAIVLGLLFSVMDWHLPSVPVKVIDMLAGASAPVALFVIGATLNSLKGQASVVDVIQTSTGKLIIQPLLLFIAFGFTAGIDPLLMVAGMISAGAPMMTIFPILGQRYGLEARCAAALVINLVLAFFTINGLLLLLRMQGWIS